MDPIAEACGHVDIVKHDDDASATFMRKPSHERQDLDLMGDIECSSRLVEQQAVCVLCDQHGDPCPLALPAGQRAHHSVGKSFDMRRLDRSLDLLPVEIGKPAKCTMPGITPAGDKLADRHVGSGAQILRQIGD
ncbi:hypothetical protein D3C80_805870 [compost metagenome]